MLLVCVCIAVLIMIWQQKKSRKKASSVLQKSQHNNSISWNIKLQILMFFVQAVLFTFVGVYQIQRDLLKITSACNNTLIFTSYLIAQAVFISQHILFVVQYTRVCLSVPLSFCLQTEEVLKERKTLMNRCTIVEISSIVTIFAVVLSEAFNKANGILVRIIWVAQVTLLTIALCIALRRLRAQ